MDTGAEPGRSRMMSQEDFARQLQLSDPHTVAGAFSYFQQVKELGQRGQSPGPALQTDMLRTSGHYPVGPMGGQFGICTIGWPSPEVCWGVHFL